MARTRTAMRSGSLPLWLLFLAIAPSCRDQREPGPTTRARLERESVAKRAAAQAAAQPPPPLALGTPVPALVAPVQLGISPATLAAARPRAYRSRGDPNAWHEELGTRTSAHYTFHAGRLYSILILGSGRAAEADLLRADAHARWGEPALFAGTPLFRAQGALVRIVTDMGNVVVELTEERPTQARPLKR